MGSNVGSRPATPGRASDAGRSPGAVPGGGPAIRILAWPARHAKNPYIPLLYDGLRKLGAEVTTFSPLSVLRTAADVWHIHWPDQLLNRMSLPQALARVGVMVVLLRVARLRGLRLVWTVHNLGTHEAYHPRLERWFWGVFTAALDGFIALTPGGKAAAEARFPALAQAMGFVVPHGHYRGCYPDSVTRSQARAALGLPQGGRVITCLGHLRAYKNVPSLIEAFRQLPDSDARLIIAGEPTPLSIGDAIERAAQPDSRVQPVLGFVAPDRVQLYLRSADLVVLPYRELLNSGGAILALSFGCPVLVSRRGAMEELALLAGSDWVRTYSGELTPATLADGLDWAVRTPRGEQCDTIAALNWPEVAQCTLEALSAVCARGEPKEHAPHGSGDYHRGDRHHVGTVPDRFRISH
jgi:beta-1,4-mannosyltransferase